MARVDVVPVADFTAYPDGKKTVFAKGDAVNVPADMAAMLEAKGMIEKPKAKKPASKSAPDAE